MKVILEKIESYNKNILIAIFSLLAITIIFCLTQKLYLFSFALFVISTGLFYLKILEKELLKKIEETEDEK